MLSDLLFRLRSLLRRGAVERELDDELRDHLEHETDKYMQAGLARPEAVRRAHLALGGLDQVKEQCRDARGTRILDELVQDLRYASRVFGRVQALRSPRSPRLPSALERTPQSSASSMRRC